MQNRFAPMPEPPYYVVIFSNQASSTNEGYAPMLDIMLELAHDMPGFIGIESSRDAQGFAVTASYWKTEDDIRAWRNHAKHKIAQSMGKKNWYDHYQLRVAQVSRQYDGP